MAKPKKPKLPAIETVEQLHSTVDEIARLEVQIRAKEAKRDAAIQHVRAEHDAVIEADKSRSTSLMKLASTYATAHKADVFPAGKKSVSTALARFGFRAGNPTLKPLNSKWTWEKVTEKLKQLGKYTRTVVEVNKEELHDAKLTDVEYAELGVRIDSGSRFFVESKSDDADRITEDAPDSAAA
ncbi:MAG: host-nuclease inhibitor Gam family protein [Luteolibacter sp.]